MGPELTDVLSGVDAREFDGLVQLMLDRRDSRWMFTGQGRSGLSGQMVAMRLMHLGREVHVVGQATAPSVRAGDVFVVISGSGRTPVSISFAETARAEGATVVVVTAHGDSPLGLMAHQLLVIPPRESNQLMGAQFEQSALLLLDSALAAVADAEPESRAGMAARHTNLL